VSAADLIAESELERARIEATAQAVEERLAARLEPKAPGVDPYTSYTLDEAAARMNISRYDLDSLRAKGLIRSRRVGGKVRLLERDIRDYYEHQDTDAELYSA
jgi:excisionase family DNA binding protein